MVARKIVVLGTGGTIAGRAQAAQDALGYKAGELGIAEILRGVPGLENVPLEAEQVANIDSKDMTLEVWRQLALRCAHHLAREDVAGIVVTHGTDTMEETAFFLQELLAPARPVVLTGAMRPASSPFADGPRNIVDAVTVAQAEGARGVSVVFAGAIHDAHDVRKVHPYRLDAFASGDAGVIGYVEEGRLRLMRNWPAARMDTALAAIKKLAEGAAWPRVEIVMSHAGAGRGLVDALVAQGVDGIVAACTGNGSLHHELEAALRDAHAKGVKVVRATRCAEGAILAHGEEALPHADSLSPVKARIRMLLALMAAR